MALLTTVRQAYTLAYPYFSPKEGNWGRIAGVAGSIFMMAFRTRYDETMRSYIMLGLIFLNKKNRLQNSAGSFNRLSYAGLFQ